MSCAFSSFVLGGFNPRLQGPQRGVDAAAEGSDSQVRSELFLLYAVAACSLESTSFLPGYSSSDLSKAEPTLTHMCIKMLHKENLVGVLK